MHPASRITHLACLGDTSLGPDATHSCAINSKKDGDVSVADISGSIGIWLNKAQDQVVALFSCQFDCGSLEVVLAIGLPARCALRIAKSKPNVTIMRFTHTGDQVVMGLDCVTVLQLEILGQSLGLFASERAFIVGQLMFFRLRQLLGQKNDRIILIVNIRSFQFTPSVHDFGGDCRRVFLVSGFIRCGGCGIIRH